MAPIDTRDREEIHPLATLEELLSWKAPESPLDEVVDVEKLCPRACPHQSSHPRTLLCHDMKGGYLDDRFYNGSSNKDAYRFYHWSGVDSFVYFSHNLVTIPPPGWISTAHQHGVKVLGTFITEWDDGKAICEKMLTDDSIITNAVMQLVRIAKYHRFEGWLINIENVIKLEQVELLLNFVEKLTAAMRKSCRDAVVIWYDSVTKEGELKWQNELNELNRPFFNACDGIFLNYTWTVEHLKRSLEAAGERKDDVYVGIDVFGRNFYEGGKFNTYKALKVVREQGLSAAIFAHGWTYEVCDNFVKAEETMWRSLSPYLIHHGPKCLPFRTSFCQGFGEKCYSKGKVASPDPWHNLIKQQFQPLWSQDDGLKMELVTNDAYNGGGCLGLSSEGTASARLLLCSIGWKVSLVVSVWYKWCDSPVPMDLMLHLRPCEEAETSSTSSCSVVTLQCEEEASKESDTPSKATADESDVTDTILSKDTLLAPVVKVEENGWTMRTFDIKENPGKELKRIDIGVKGCAKLVLGELHIYNRCIKGLHTNKK